MSDAELRAAEWRWPDPPTQFLGNADTIVVICNGWQTQVAARTREAAERARQLGSSWELFRGLG